MSYERLAKYIARCGVASRRRAEVLIKDGHVRVNGTIVNNVATKIATNADSVTIDNKRIAIPQQHYVMFNKPAGVVTTKSDPHAGKTVLDYIPTQLKDVHPIGRLDKNTTGLLLLTNDGKLTFQLTHPRHGVTKTYTAVVRGTVNTGTLNKIQQGVKLEDGITQPTVVTHVRRRKQTTDLTITLKEGRKRQIRRMFSVLGHPVIELKRVAVGTLRLGALPEGSFRPLRTQELERLRESINAR